MRRTNSWSETAVATHQSIWSETFRVKKAKEKKLITPKKERQLAVKTPSTRGKVVVLKTDSLRKEITPRKRTFEGEYFGIFFYYTENKVTKLNTMYKLYIYIYLNDYEHSKGMHFEHTNEMMYHLYANFLFTSSATLSNQKLEAHNEIKTKHISFYYKEVLRVKYCKFIGQKYLFY